MSDNTNKTANSAIPHHSRNSTNEPAETRSITAAKYHASGKWWSKN